jgi:2,3-dihydroxybenzoate decarboxylase
MRYIALEEAFSIPGLGDPLQHKLLRARRDYAQQWQRKLADFTEYRLPEMDEAGIDIQVLSLTVPGVQVDIDAAAARDNARRANDVLGQVISEHPTRFRGFAALPLQDTAAAVTELQRCVTELGFCGALVNDHLQGHYLDEPQYDPLWDALESLGVPLYLHPGAPPADQWHVLGGHPELYGAMWSWGAEVGGHALRTVFGGVFDRHPRATLILGHMGEFLPYQRSRLDSRYRTLQIDRELQQAPSANIGTNIVFTNSGVFSPAALAGAVAEVGADAIMFSVDYPYESSREAVDSFERTPLSPADRDKIAHGNAQRILGI